MNANKAQQAYTALSNAGLSEPVLSWAWGEAAFESAGFTSDNFVNYNNASGITYSDNSVSGTTDSLHQMTDSDLTLAAYPDINTWAADFVRVLSLSPGRPVDATDLNDYVNRLSQNGYFGTGSKSAYLSGLQSELNVEGKYISPSLTGVNTVLTGSANDTTGTVDNPAAKWLQNPANKSTIIYGGSILGLLLLSLLIAVIFHHVKKSTK